MLLTGAPNTVMKSKTPIFLLLAGYTASLLVYLIWYYKIWPYSQYGKNIADPPNIKTVIVSITALYLFLYFLILYINSLQTPWKSFFFVTIVTLLTFFSIPSVYIASYHFEKAKNKILSKKKRMEEVETKLKFEIAMNDASKKLITELQAKLESERKENERLRKQLDETTQKTNSLEEEHKTKREVVVQAKLNKDFSKIKINSELGKTDSDINNREIIFKVQIISSSTRLATNSPQFQGLKDVCEYKDSGLYKYTVGNQKDLKSASDLQSELRRKGFNGAFVVTFNNGKRIPVREALRLLN